MTENEKQQEQWKPLLIHIWKGVDAHSGVAKTLNWMIFPTSSVRRGVIFAMAAVDEESAREKVERLIPSLNWTVEDVGNAFIAMANCSQTTPYVPLLFEKYPARIISVEYPTKPTVQEILAVYTGRMSQELRLLRGDFTEVKTHA